MTSGCSIPMILSGEDAVRKIREINGATDPKDAAEGTIRKKYATNGRENAVHASDSPETAAEEIEFFFGGGLDD